MESCARDELNCLTHHLRQLAPEPRPSPRPSRVLRSQGFTKHAADEALEPKWLRILCYHFLAVVLSVSIQKRKGHYSFAGSRPASITYGLLSKNKITTTPQLLGTSQHSHCSLVTIHCRLFARLFLSALVHELTLIAKCSSRDCFVFFALGWMSVTARWSCAMNSQVLPPGRTRWSPRWTATSEDPSSRTLSHL